MRQKQFRMVPLLLLPLLAAGLSGCLTSVSSSQNEIGANPSYQTHERGELVQVGKASWYGGRFHGQPTASGEIFNKWEKTAAHRTLPLGTWLIVERESNGREVKVKVNDRGPFVEGRVIDLSRGAAAKINMLEDGVDTVKLYRVRGTRKGVETSAETSRDKFTIQVGSFVRRSNALALKSRLEDRFDNVHLTYAYNRFHRVRVGFFESKSRARTVEETLQSMGFDTWLVAENPGN